MRTLAPDTLRALELGRRLFNAGRWWEAHEAWESAWIDEEGEARQLLQGLIQVAAGYFKATVHRRPSGAVKLLGAGLEKLAPLDADAGGLELAPFRAAVASSLAAAQRWMAGELPCLDPTLAPRLSAAEQAGTRPPAAG
jgi:predicted metal-dependent hydrolase